MQLTCSAKVANRVLRAVLDNERILYWLVQVVWIDCQHISEHRLHREVAWYNQGPGWLRTNWKSTVEGYFRRWNLSGMKQKQQLRLTDSSCGMWPDISTWMSADLMSRPLVHFYLGHQLFCQSRVLFLIVFFHYVCQCMCVCVSMCKNWKTTDQNSMELRRNVCYAER